MQIYHLSIYMPLLSNLFLLAIGMVALLSIQLATRDINHVCLVPSKLEGREARVDIESISRWVSLEYASIDPNLWGLYRYTGMKGLAMGYSSIKVVNGSLLLKTDLDLSRLPLYPHQVIAYNEIIFGYKPWGVPKEHPLLDKPLRFPVRVGDLPRVILYTVHSLLNANTWMNIAYDLWLLSDGDSIRPPRQGDYEIMIWIYRQGITPAGSKVGEFSMPILVNGEVMNARWEIWHMRNVPWGGWEYVALALVNPLQKGSIAIDLRSALEETAKLLNIDLRDYYLVGIEFGSEIFYSGQISVEWRLDKYCISTHDIDVGVDKALQISRSIVEMTHDSNSAASTSTILEGGSGDARTITAGGREVSIIAVLPIVLAFSLPLLAWILALYRRGRGR